MYCVNENEGANSHFAFFFYFSFFPSVTIIKIIWIFFFGQRFLSNYLRFGTKLYNDELYCVTKENSHILLISPFILFIFFLSNKIFCHRFLGSFWSQCFQNLCTPSGREGVLYK